MFLMSLCSCIFRDARSGCLCEVSPFGATIQKAVLRQAMGCLASFLALWYWLWVLGELWEREKSTPSDCGHSGVQYQDVWHIRLPNTCGYQQPGQILNFTVNRKRENKGLWEVRLLKGMSLGCFAHTVFPPEFPLGCWSLWSHNSGGTMNAWMEEAGVKGRGGSDLFLGEGEDRMTIFDPYTD